MATINLSVNVTYRCNTVCRYCDRGVGVVDTRDVRDMTPEDAHRLVDGVVSSGHKVHKVKVMGGEPTLNRHLAEIVDAFAPICDTLWVVSNGLRPVEQLPRIRFRRRNQNAKYRFESLDRKEHYAFFMSPTDLGKEHWMQPLDQCIAVLLCGRGVEPEGFVQCSVARTIVRGLGRGDAALSFSDEPVLTQDREICRHCPLSMGQRRNKAVAKAVERGELEHPTRSFVGVRADSKVLCMADAHVGHKWGIQTRGGCGECAVATSST